MALTTSNSFKELSNSMNGVLSSFRELYEKVLAEHNESARKVTQVCYDLHLEFHDQMSQISKVYNDSVNSMENISEELNMAQQLQELDISAIEEIKSSVEKLTNITKSYKEQTNKFYSEAVTNYEDIEKVKTSLEKKRPKYDFLKEIGWDSIPENSSNNVIIGHFFLSAIAVAVDGIFQIINFGKYRKYKGLEALMTNLTIKSQDLLTISNKFNGKLLETLTQIDNYTISVDKILKYKDQPKRVLIMAEGLIDKTDTLQKKFQDLREQAIQNKEDLSDKLIRFNPRGLIEK